jgi:hypothetical protein
MSEQGGWREYAISPRSRPHPRSFLPSALPRLQFSSCGPSVAPGSSVSPSPRPCGARRPVSSPRMQVLAIVNSNPASQTPVNPLYPIISSERLMDDTPKNAQCKPANLPEPVRDEIERLAVFSSQYLKAMRRPPGTNSFGCGGRFTGLISCKSGRWTSFGHEGHPAGAVESALEERGTGPQLVGSR